MNDKHLILVVDDDSDLVEMIAMKLQNEGFRVARAYDGIEAMEAIEKERPALIVLDVMMPRKDGYQLCSELKNSDEYKDITIILLTAVARAVDSTNYTHMDGRTTLADEFLGKPIDLDRLVEIVSDNL